MSKIISKKRNSTVEIELLKKFREVDTCDFPDFHRYETPLERSLWVLWVAKEKLQIKKLTAEQIASIIVEIKEVNVTSRSVTYSLNRAGTKVYIYHENEEVYYKIMKSGEDYLVSQIKKGSIEVFYFEPDKRYTSKRVLSKNILDSLKGELRIVDPYCGERTLDILNNVKNRVVKFLTRVENLREKARNRFLRELQDFKSENPNMEFRNYPHTDIHDRYIISSELLVILGHSIKDLGGKESFAVILNKGTNKNIVEALIENFNKRWQQSNTL